MAGLYTNADFDAQALIAQAASEASTIDGIAERAVSLIRPGLSVAVERMRTEGSTALELLEKAGTYLQICLAGFDGSVPIASARQFVPGGNVQVWKWPGDHDPETVGCGTLLMGEYQAFAEHKQANPLWAEGADAPERIVEILARQAEHSPNIVGPPFSVLAIEQNRVEWLAGDK
jgi:hypothetical protein